MSGTIKLSSNQINKMKHALGLNHQRPRRGSYSPYRNAYITSDDPEWNELVEQGLARKATDPFHDGSFVYSVTTAGTNQLEMFLDIKINSNQ